MSLRSRALGWRAWLLVGVVGCAARVDDEPDIAGSSQAIVYGNDDRLDVYEHPDPALRAIAQSSVVSLIPRAQFVRGASGGVRIRTRLLGDALGLCPGERFADQPTAAVCTGVLLDDDLVLTAGHCLPEDVCERYAFVFDYHYRAPPLTPDGPAESESISLGDIYGCRRIVDKVLDPERVGSRIDYALVQLDRPAAGRVPVEVRTTPLLPGEPLATIGCSSGLPVKIDSGSRVLDTRPATSDYFLLDSDTFEGSSGSGVFDVSAKLVGVLVRGGTDYVQVGPTRCMAASVVSVPDGSVPRGLGEEATYASRVIEGLCRKGWPSARLCGKEPVCGDGFCSATESRALCPQDCNCNERNCEAKSAPPAAAGALVKSNHDDHDDDGCALGARRDASSLFGVLALLALRSWRGRRRRAAPRRR